MRRTVASIVLEVSPAPQQLTCVAVLLQRRSALTNEFYPLGNKKATKAEFSSVLSDIDRVAGRKPTLRYNADPQHAFMEKISGVQHPDAPSSQRGQPPARERELQQKSFQQQPESARFAKQAPFTKKHEPDQRAVIQEILESGWDGRRSKRYPVDRPAPPVPEEVLRAPDYRGPKAHVPPAVYAVMLCIGCLVVVMVMFDRRNH
jgi:hypothetical protein